MKYWHLWHRCFWNCCVPAEHFDFAMLAVPTEIWFVREKNANSYTQKYSNATWQTTDILNIITIPHTYQQLATSCPSWNHSFTPELEECSPSSTFRMAWTPITPTSTACGGTQCWQALRLIMKHGIKSKDMAW